jgi:transposase
MLPQEMGCGSGMTCWRRVRDWQEVGVWNRLQHALLDRLGRRNAIDFRRAALDSASVTARRGARQRGPNLTDCGKPGSKRHVLTDANGIPLAVRLTGGNVHDSGMLKEVVDAVLPIRQALPAARQAACRQGLRSPPLPPRPDQPPHPASDRTPWHPEQRQAGAAPLDSARRNLPKTNTKTAPISPSHLNPVLIPPGLSPVTRQIVRDWVERSMPRVWLNLLTTKRTVDLCYWLQEEHRVTGAKRGGLFVG